LSVTELLAAFARGAAKPSGLLAALRARWTDAELAGRSILAVIDGADAAVAESDRRWGAGTARPLEGIPFAVKDIIDVAGAPVTSGSHTTGERVAQADATVVARLRAAGAIPVLMTATTEFACGAPANARYGAVTNPWDRTRWTGGSSTGSAGALAARLIPLALGSDTGGSIRVPSALCNLTGIKPTYGLVPRTGVASLSWTLDHVGPMARSAADLRLVLPHVVGPDGADPAAVTAFSAERPDVDGLSPLVGLRVGISSSWFTELCDSGVLAAYRSALDTLVQLGSKVFEVDLGDLALIHDDVALILTSELASNQEANLDRFELFDIGTQVRIARGLVPTAADYLRSLRRRVVAQRTAVAALEGVDVLVTPGVGATAARLSDVTVEIDGLRHPMQSIIGRNTGIFDYLGLPAVMAPAGLVGGMPVGVQFVGRPWADEVCLWLAEVLQSVTGHHLRGPGGLDG
jgi:aspartyl-tRNA(Asn)/glutamyl-tRNA(Gln) amidotransferase subunit A